MKVKNQLLSLKAYQPGLSTDEIKKRYGLTKVFRLDANENPYGCSPRVAEALSQHLGEMSLYPDGTTLSLRQELAERLEIAPQSLLFGNGLDEVIQIISRALLSPGTNIVMASPTFPQYRHHAIIEGAGVKEIPTINGRHDLEKMRLAIDDQTRIAWVCNPNNPTGTYINETELTTFMEGVPEETLVIVDEAYIDFVSAVDFPNALPLLKRYKNLMFLRTFSKAYGLASFRVGYAVGNPELIQQLEVTRLPFNTNRFGQLAAVAALGDEAFLTECVAGNRKTLESFSTFCDQYGIDYYPSETNFIYIKTNVPNDFYEALLQRGYAVRPFPTGIRVTMPKLDDCEEFLFHMKDIVLGRTRHLRTS